MADGSAYSGRGHAGDNLPGKRAAIIGSGFGGLAAAIRLQASGFKTTLFEARDKPGGRAYVYEQDGYVFDAGPTVITAPECIDELFTLAGRRREDYVELLPVNPFYRLLWEDGTRFDYTGEAADMERQIGELSPRDVAGYRKFLKYTARVFEKGYTELAATPFLNFFDMVRVAPHLARLRADRSVYQTVSRFVQNPHLREALSFHSLLVGGNPFDTSAIYTLIHHLERSFGVWFPRGGTGALVRGLVQLYRELGGELRLASPVQGIRVSERSGKTTHFVRAGSSAQAPEEPFDLVVSNADLHHTYQKLYSDQPAAKRMQRKLESSEWSMSLFVLYFGTNRAYDLAHHTILFGRRYEELLREIFDGPSLPRDFSLYLHAPSVTDASLAPPGGATFYVLSPVPHLGKAAIDWQKESPRYAARIYSALERYMPNLRQHLVTERWFTPQDFQTTLGAFQGSAFSVAPRLTQSAYFRPHNRDDHIPGLYLVGAGTHPGAGLPGVINSAKATASLVVQDFPVGVAP
ncbi:MAG TPA: phytoene desaturase [Polyangiaceae bacterium]|nr:phytoene desaturase [Polyangiaceae bacterium]